MIQTNHTELLQQIFENVNGWLHFIEAKNAALIAFNIALLSVLLGSSLLEFCMALSSGIAIGLLCSTLISLWSFKPINNDLEKPYTKEISFNLLHYASVASLTVDDYLAKIYKHYWNDELNDGKFLQLERDYASEIIQNSRIALRKQTYFNFALKADVIMIFAICVLFICA